MRIIGILCLALFFCSAALADDFFHWGKVKEREFNVSWHGPDPLPSQAGQDAGDYVETISDYDAVGRCSTVYPASLAYPCNGLYILVQTDGMLTLNARGRAFCTTETVDANGYCTGKMRISVHPNYNDAQNTWCHEMGHIFGVKHDTGYGGNCMDDFSSTDYDPHHVQNHMQYQSVSH